MDKIWLLAAVVVACEARQPAIGAGSLPIVNGTLQPETVALTDAEIMAIGWLYWADTPTFPFCSGTLIAPDLVATAAHCVWGAAAGEIGFGVGIDPNWPDGLYPSIGIFPNREVDVAVIRLGEDVTASRMVSPIRVNEAALDDTLVDEPMQVGGYGETLIDDSNDRLFATVYVSDVRATEVLVDGRGLQGLCFGDSGSGLIRLGAGHRPEVLAVESTGDVSCVGIDHMTRLDTIWDWIAPVLDGVIPPDPCEGIGEEGLCEGNVAVSCLGEFRREINCSIWGTECSWVEESARYACPCGPVPRMGWCERDVVELCHEGRVLRTDCAAYDQRCGFVLGEGRYSCTGAPACVPEDAAGRCVGDTAVNCDGAAVSTRDLCTLDGRVCLETAGGAICTEPGPEPDAGVDAGGDGDADAGDGGEPDADAAPPADGGVDPRTPEGSGCACGAAAPSPPTGVLLLLSSLLAVVWRRALF